MFFDYDKMFEFRIKTQRMRVEMVINKSSSKLIQKHLYSIQNHVNVIL